MARDEGNEISDAPELHHIAPWVVGALLLLPSLTWITRDQSAWPWDQSLYGETSVRLWDRLLHKPTRWPRHMVKALEVKAPGVAWLGQFWVPLGQGLGSIELGLLLSILATQFMTLQLLHRTLRRVCPAQPFLPYAGMMMAAAAPLFVGLTHQYFAEPLQLFAVTWFYWLAMAASGLSFPRLTAHLLGASALAMIAKATTPLYCALPAAWVGWTWVRARRGGASLRPVPRADRARLIAALVLFVLTFVWYVKHLRQALHFVREASTGSLALMYGENVSWLTQLKYWLGATQRSFCPRWLAVLGLLSVGVILTWIVLRVVRRRDGPCTSVHPLVLAAVVEVLMVLAVMAGGVNQETRFLLPLLPSLVLGFVGTCSLLAWRWPALLIMGASVAQWVHVHWAATGTRWSPVQNWNRSDNHIVMHAHGLSEWILPAQPEGREKRELWRIVERTITPANERRVHVCGMDLSWLNANSLAFIAVQHQLRTQIVGDFTSLGWAENDPDRAWQRIDGMNCATFVSLQEGMQPDPPTPWDRVSRAILKKVREDPRFVSVPFESSLGVVMFQNLEPVRPKRAR